MTQKIILFIICTITLCFANLPSNFQKCNRKHEDFQKCFKLSLQNAITQLTQPFKEIGLPILDPIVIPELSISAGSSAAAFSQKYTNFKMSGLSKCECSKAYVDFKELSMGAGCLCPELLTTFYYEFDGKLLMLPFGGKGNGETIISNGNATLKFYLEEYQKKGASHYKIKKTDFSMFPDKMVMKFENLFGGDSNLNKNLNDLMNENWKSLYSDVGANYDKAFSQVFQAVFNQILAKVSVEEMFGDN